MSENLMIGLTLMIIGMGFVMLFLCIMIAAMFGMSAVVRYLNKIFPEKAEVVEKKKSASKSVAKDDEAVAVALAAIMSKR
mgnify:FL=1